MTSSIYIIIISSLSGVGILAGGLGYLIQSYKGGSKKEKIDVISSADQLSNFWKDQVEGYKAMTADKDRQITEKDTEWNKKFNEMAREIGEIKGQLVEKEKQAAQYLDILNNRDPEMKKFMELMVAAANNQSEVNKEVVRILGDIHSMAVAEHERDFSITNTSTITKS